PITTPSTTTTPPTTTLVEEPTTLEELKEAKITNPSEYDKCLKEIEENEKKFEACIREKVEQKGYTDGIDCIQDFQNPVCASTERYNAEVYANNDCLEQKDPNELNLFDCLRLVQQ
ncbi:MAG: hypothetical protein ACE5J5_05290, partial [Candidatus Hydrothermarchaeales archaeon]